jgi:RNA polymerase sigma-70 factor (ECF subfamily)
MHLPECQPSQSWEILIQQARRGCRGCRGQLLNECRGYLLVIANQWVNDRLQAKVGGSDLVQQTLLHALRDFDDFRGQEANELFAWLRSILINQIARARRDFLDTDKRDVSREVPLGQRTESHHPASWLPADVETPSRLAVAAEDELRLKQAVDRLNAPYQRVIELRNRDLLTFAEIGERMSISADRARRLWVRAIERLRRDLASEKTD